MSRNFKVGTRVRVKQSGKIGIIKSKETKINDFNNNVTIAYIVKFGEGIENWASFSRRELELIKNDTILDETVYPQIITTQYSFNKRTLVMVGVVEKVKQTTYTKCKDFNENEGECFKKHTFKGKKLSIGWSILHPEDDYDVLVGESIAVRRAKKHPISILYSECNGEFNTDLVESILKNKSEYIFENLEKFIN